MIISNYSGLYIVITTIKISVWNVYLAFNTSFLWFDSKHFWSKKEGSIKINLKHVIYIQRPFVIFHYYSHYRNGLYMLMNNERVIIWNTYIPFKLNLCDEANFWKKEQRKNKRKLYIYFEKAFSDKWIY